MIGSMVRWGAIFGGFSRDDDSGGAIGLIAMAIIAPIAAMILQLAISRQNEYVADATGARIAGNPMGLASALRKLDAYAHRIPMQVNPAAAQLAIINPLSGVKGAGLFQLFNTHPSTEERVARLAALAGSADLDVR